MEIRWKKLQLNGLLICIFITFIFAFIMGSILINSGKEKNFFFFNIT